MSTCSQGSHRDASSTRRRAPIVCAVKPSVFKCLGYPSNALRGWTGFERRLAVHSESIFAGQGADRARPNPWSCDVSTLMALLQFFNSLCLRRPSRLPLGNLCSIIIVLLDFAPHFAVSPSQSRHSQLKTIRRRCHRQCSDVCNLYITRANAAIGMPIVYSTAHTFNMRKCPLIRMAHTST